MSEDLSDLRDDSASSSSEGRQWIDKRVLDDEPIIKTSNPYKSSPQYECPHCICDITPASSVWEDDEDEEVPEEVRRHIRQCNGLQTYHLGLAARRKQKAQVLAARRE